MSEQIYSELTRIFRDVLDRDDLELHPMVTAEDIPEWDSFAHVNIIVATEMTFGIKFMTAELERLRNVGELASLIERKLARG
ncbi:MAG: acyl carrier protein [Rhodospirillales bacterium]|jgi:acyl carrier protein|nr:acyl carrier protein [Rhodospirillales bacterium]